MLDKDTGTTRLILKDESCNGYSFDFTSVKKENLENDFKRRDFTINALAIDLKHPNEILDYFNGITDLKEKKINAINLKNLTDDPLRFLRTFRFAAQINGMISQEIITFIKENINYFNENIAGERISTELWKTLDSTDSFPHIKLMSESLILEKIFPELIKMRKVPPNDHHHLPLYEHSIELVKTFEEKISIIPNWAKDELKDSLSIIKLGCIFHDIGKPDTWEIKNIEGKEKHTFIGHDKLGAEMVVEISERLKFSSATTNILCNLVRHHLRPFQLSNNNTQISDRALFRFFRDLNSDTPKLLMLSLADLHATLGPKITKEDLDKNENLILFLFNEYKKYTEKEEEKAKKPKLLDGNEIMEITGIQPSRKLGDLIKELDELIGIGEITTKEEAVEWVKKIVP